MAAPAGDAHEADRRAAAGTGLALAAVNAEPRSGSRPARRRRRGSRGESCRGGGWRAAGPRRTAGHSLRQEAAPGGVGRLRMDAGFKQDLVGVDIADAGNDPLVQQASHVPPRSPARLSEFGEPEGQGLGPDPPSSGADPASAVASAMANPNFRMSRKRSSRPGSRKAMAKWVCLSRGAPGSRKKIGRSS